jgi:hypothetical protein
VWWRNSASSSPRVLVAASRRSWGMGKSQIRASCEDLLDGLDLPHRFTTRQLVDAVAELRGKPIVLQPLDSCGLADVPCGIRIETPTQDTLYIEKGASSVHQMHIVAHEIGHIMFDHPGSLSLGDDAVSAVGFNPTLVLRMSGRSAYRSTDEVEAELLATLIRQRAYRDHIRPSTRPARADDRWDALLT